MILKYDQTSFEVFNLESLVADNSASNYVQVQVQIQTS